MQCGFDYRVSRAICYPLSAIIEYAGKEVCTGRDSTSVHKQCDMASVVLYWASYWIYV